MQRLKAGDGSSAFPDFDSDKCDDGLPEGNFTTEEKCYFYSKLCPDDRMINYLEFRYCTLGDNLAAIIFGMALIVVWLLTLFYMLSQAAESHFCPMLSEISSALRMSPDLAGMSILAFGNGFVFLYLPFPLFCWSLFVCCCTVLLMCSLALLHSIRMMSVC